MAEIINIEDIELAKLCARGDEKARHELYTRYAAYLYALCIRYVGNRELARDLMHDAMIKIFDTLIAGYNIASEKEKMQYKRLRGLIGGMLIMLALLTVILLGLETMIAALSYAAITIALCIAVIILANTWAKNKNN